MIQNRALMPVTPEAIDLIKRWSPKGVCEIGAGQGLWVRALREANIPAIGYDPHPGESVLKGDHTDANKHPNLTLLIIWPPDGDVIPRWVLAYRGNTVITGVNKGRVDLGNRLSTFDMKETLTVTEGRKGQTILSAWTR